MDFTFSSEADQAAALTADLLRSPRDAEGTWQVLAEAGLLALCLPESDDATAGADPAAGLGLVEQCRVLVEVGRVVAPGPIATHVAAARYLADHGTPEQRATWLPPAATGASLLAPALAEPHHHRPAPPTVTAADGLLTGTKTLVRGGLAADALLVTAEADGRFRAFLVAADAPGLIRSAQRLSDGDEVALLELRDTPGEEVGDAEALADLVELFTCAEQLGVTEGALRLTASYAATREQFGRPIGTFQAVAHRLADGHLDVLGQRLTLWQAAWRMDAGLLASTELATAVLWAADAGHRIAHTTVHVHGGVGIDLEGEAHRYFTAATRHEFELGGATDAARRIGASRPR